MYKEFHVGQSSDGCFALDKVQMDVLLWTKSHSTYWPLLATVSDEWER